MSASSTTSTNQTVLRAEALGRVVAERAIVTDVSFTVERVALLGIVGASGSGKSSLLRLLNRLDEPSSGTVYLDDRDYREIPPRELRCRVGMVTQRPFMFPGDAATNLRYGPAQRGVQLGDDAVESLLARVGLSGFATRDTAVLSGGEQQRVSLARALANEPEVLLLDEPTSALDEESKRGIEELVSGLVQREHLTCVMVTHDRAQARRMCSKVLLMEAGRLVRAGGTEEVLGA